MADFGFPFRRETRLDPYILPVRPVGQEEPVWINKERLHQLGCKSFEWVNLSPVTCWLRGWNGDKSAMPAIADKGHALGPGAGCTKSSQFPDWVAVVCTDEPLYPIFDDQGRFLYPTARSVLTYGTGL